MRGLCLPEGHGDGPSGDPAAEGSLESPSSGRRSRRAHGYGVRGGEPSCPGGSESRRARCACSRAGPVSRRGGVLPATPALRPREADARAIPTMDPGRDEIGLRSRPYSRSRPRLPPTGPAVASRDLKRRECNAPEPGDGSTPIGKVGRFGMSTSATQVTPGALLRARSEVVRGLVRGAHARPGGRLARDRLGRAHADLRPDRLGQDPRLVPLGHRPPRPRARAARLGRADRLRLAAQGTLLRHRAQPEGPAAGDRRADLGRAAHGRHAAVRAAEDAPEPPDILITTPESLYLMISSGAREILGGVEAVIVDEIHAVAPSKRGSHLALTLERLDHGSGTGEPVQTHRPLGDPAAARADRRSSWSAPGASARSSTPASRSSSTSRSWSRSRTWWSRARCRKAPRRRRHRQDAAPDLKHSPERIDPGPIEASLDPATNTRSIWPAIYPELLRLVREHNSTIVFVNNRRAAERIAKRLNEMHNDELDGGICPPPSTRVHPKSGEEAQPEIARAHHGSLSHEERALVEELLKSGELPCLVATSSLELGIDMGAVDLVIQVESPKSVTRGLQRVGRAGHTLGEISKGRIFPKFRADLLECAVVARRMRSGRDRGDGHPAEPPRRAGPAPGLDGGARRVGDRRGREARALGTALRRALPRAARERARHARRPLSVGALRRAAARGSSGTAPRARCAAGRARASWRSPTRARSPTAASTGSTCRTAAGSASSTRRWSTRPGPARPSCSGRAPGGSRRSPATG